MRIEWEYVDAGLPIKGSARYWRESFNPVFDAGYTGKWCCFIIKDMYEPQYFISAMIWGKPDLGPFATLQDAKLVAETMIRLNALPEGWK